MCEHDATIRDLQTSLQRSQETIEGLREELTLARGVGRALALSMRTEGTPDWKRACFRLAYRLASQLDKPDTVKELTAFMYLTDALDDPEPTKDTAGD
jgi:hypothetical protein